MTANIILLVLFIFLSAFFSASETAIFSLTKARFRRLKERYPSAKRLNPLFRRPSLTLSTIVFGNIWVNIGLASLTTSVLVSIFGQRGVAVSIIFSGVIILFLGEILPKSFAVYVPERISLFSAPLLLLIMRFFYPILTLTQKIVDSTSYLFLGRKKEEKLFSEDELKEALFFGKKHGDITSVEEEMISYLLEFKDTCVSEVMTPRVEIQGIEINFSHQSVMDSLKSIRHSKLPVYRESLDNIVGILYAKDVFLNPHQDWKKFLRSPLFVPESKKIDDLLREFLTRGEHIAIVLDEYGGTSGLVTLEDIEEEIFGEIYDEFEIPYKMIEQIEERKWRVYGKVPLKTLNLELDLNLPEEEDTVAGLILSKLERIPHTQERLKIGEVEFVIERATARRIISVILNIEK
ncbi:MAG: HlyC/CorC family transporter [Candidatus Omnitrophica bacterium]|nr:HlyC/CorC family transporter [Candidatus Omnitrophota bacterium]